MRNLILSSILLASAFQTALGEESGEWTYSVQNNQATITGYTGSGGALTIPREVNGITVVTVGSDWPPVFSLPNSNTVISINIPDSVTSIGQNAFNNCTSLTSITIPNSVGTIGNSAFIGCNSLISITIPSSVKTIEPYAFNGCTSLTSITIPNGVMSIENGAFNYCTSLTSINIPNGVIGIASNAFKNCSGLQSVTFPTSLTTIENNAFEGCTSLRSIIIPNGVGTIGNNAFLNCTSLTSITMPNRFIGQIAQIGISGQVATDYLVNALANNDAFVTAVANKIKGTAGNYGIATQGLLFNVTGNLATKSELTSSLAQSRTDGVNSVLSNPNLWTLYTTSQIQNMAVGDLVLNREANGSFVLSYDIEQSTDLQTWTPYQALSLPLTGLPTDKAFVRIKAKQ